jgi:DNA invertase Pin-like site-specific DNA recombinase
LSSNDIKRVVGYIRTSTTMQEDSPATQLHHIQDYCNRQGFNLVRVYTDEAVSAFKVDMVDRPAGSQLLSDIKARRRGFDAVVVLRLDRAFRSPRDQEDTLLYCAYHKCEVWETDSGCVDMSSPVSEFMVSLRALLARMESRRTGQRTKEGLERVLAQGKKPSGYCPLGLTYDKSTKQIHANDRAADVVQIYQWYAEGTAYHEIARRLNQDGRTTARGSVFTPSVIAELLRNSYYRQSITFGGKAHPMPELIPRIVPAELTDRVDMLLASVKVLSGRAKGSPRAYSGRLVCAECGRLMVATSSQGHRRWRCQNRNIGLCNTRHVSENYINRMVGDAMSQLMGMHRTSVMGAKAPKVKVASTVEVRRGRLEAQRKRLVQDHITGRLAKVGIDYDTEWQRIESEIAALDAPKVLRPVTPAQVGRFFDDLEEGWAGVPEDLKKRWLIMLDARITIGCVVDTPLWIELECNIHSEPIRAAIRHGGRRGKREFTMGEDKNDQPSD